MKLHTLTAKNPCGGCTACCTVVSARDLGKPFYTPCPHKVERGCGIYAQRPQSCREFNCIWAAGLLADAESFRPDRNGLVFSLKREGDALWIDVFEAAAGAADDSRRLENLLQRITSRIERIEPVTGTRLHRFGATIGLAFMPDAARWPEATHLAGTTNRYAPIAGNIKRQELTRQVASGTSMDRAEV